MVFENNNMVSKEWTKYGVKMSMTWNSENRMTESLSQNIYSGAKTLTRYKYDHEGNRVVKSSNYGEVVTPSAEISYRNDSIVTKHIFVSGVRVASKVCDDKSSNTYYQSVDHLGSTNILTDAKGEFYEHVETFPDGTVWVKEYVNQSGVNTVFTSHEMDVETKFFYAKARYYDAQLGRFISVDPIIDEYLPTGDKKRDKNMPGFGGFYNPVNINMYSYGANNPMTFVDPTGKTYRRYQRNRYLKGGDGVRSGRSTYGRNFNIRYRAGKFKAKQIYEAYNVKYTRGSGGKVPKISTLKVNKVRKVILNNKLNRFRNVKGDKTVTGKLSVAEADYLGKRWVGDGYKTVVSKKGEIIYQSQDGLRKFRAPTYKGGKFSKTNYQANFESRKMPEGRFTNNAHIDVNVNMVNGSITAGEMKLVE